MGVFLFGSELNLVSKGLMLDNRIELLNKINEDLGGCISESDCGNDNIHYFTGDRYSADELEFLARVRDIQTSTFNSEEYLRTHKGGYLDHATTALFYWNKYPKDRVDYWLSRGKRLECAQADYYRLPWAIAKMDKGWVPVVLIGEPLMPTTISSGLHENTTMFTIPGGVSTADGLVNYISNALRELIALCVKE